MDHDAGIDVSLEHSSVCVVDATGRIVCEAKVTSEPEALIAFLIRLNLPLARIGLEAGPLSQWLHADLVRARTLCSRERCGSRRSSAGPWRWPGVVA